MASTFSSRSILAGSFTCMGVHGLNQDALVVLTIPMVTPLHMLDDAALAALAAEWPKDTGAGRHPTQGADTADTGHRRACVNVDLPGSTVLCTVACTQRSV